MKWTKVTPKPQLPPAKRVTDWKLDEKLAGYYLANNEYDFPTGTVQYYDILIAKVNGDVVTHDSEVVTLRGSQMLDRLFAEVELNSLIGLKYLGQEANGLNLEHQFVMQVSDAPKLNPTDLILNRVSGRK